MADDALREVYSAANIQEAHLLRALLEAAGIEARVVGDHLQNAVGDLPAVSIAPRLWVRSESFDEARKIIQDQLTRNRETAKPASKWKCGECGEWNEPSFDICWQCQRPCRAYQAT
jgi:hypothetical protein